MGFLKIKANGAIYCFLYPSQLKELSGKTPFFICGLLLKEKEIFALKPTRPPRGLFYSFEKPPLKRKKPLKQYIRLYFFFLFTFERVYILFLFTF